jgi:hypothetical protein
MLLTVQARLKREETMKITTRIGIFGCLIALALLIMSPAVAQAKSISNCAWPIELSPEGYGNATGPETLARYFTIPFDTQYDSMTIKGAYPHARYFSYVVYEDEAPSAILTDIYDTNVAPDPGSVNPFVRPDSKTKPMRGPVNGTYTLTFSRTQPSSGNTIHVPSDHFVWIMLRLYVPNGDPSLSGKSLAGGVPLPTVQLARNGANTTLPVCAPVNDLQDINILLQDLFEGVVLNNPEDMPSSDRLWFAPPEVPPIRLLPNPHIKYIATLPGDNYQPGRIIVIHGKAPGTPNTYDGSPVWEPARGTQSVDMRYWSLCNVNLQLPVTTADCTADQTTKLEGGYYTVVISNDLLRPEWLRPNVTWLRWGDEGYPKLIFFRNMLSAPEFPYSVPKAFEAGCTFKFELPNIPNSDDTIKAGQCAQGIMGDYYPVAGWCDKDTFVHGGWQACMKGK